MTKKEMFVEIKNRVADNAEMVAFIDHEIELLSKKRSTDSKAKKEADERAERLYNALAEFTEKVSISDLKKMTSDEEVAGWSSQRISALFRKLGDRVKKTVEKKVAYFEVA